MMRKKPMLAYPVSTKPIDYSKPVFMQPKLDGVRCIIQAEPWVTNEASGYDVVAYSRTGKEWKNIDHILFNLKPFFQLNPNIVLDGELYNHDFKDNFEKIISMVRKTKPTDEARTESAWNSAYSDLDVSEEYNALGEAAKLMTLMNLYKEDEEYEKCAVIKDEIKKVKQQLKKFK